MDRLYRTLAQFGKLQFRTRQDDDWIDRANYVYTSVILIICSIIVSTKQYVGEPIICWTPAQFTSAHQKYANNICWIANTYWLPMAEEIPPNIKTREDKELSYYQWVPFVLLLQSIFFYLPCIVWRTMNGQSGINIKTIVRLAVDVHNLNPDTRQKTIKYLSRHLQLCIEYQREYRTGWSVRLRQFIARNLCLVCGKRYGNYLVILYFFTKALYAFNAIIEIIFLEAFLGTNYTLYGLQVLADLQRGREWEESGRFPRVTMCDFTIRQIGNLHRHSVQCVLPINMFNEKLFIFLWFWFWGVAIATSINLLTWAGSMGFRTARVRFIKKYLKVLNRITKRDDALVDRFVVLYLRYDGVFALRLIAGNAGDLVVSEILDQMWQNFCHKPLQEPTKMDFQASLLPPQQLTDINPVKKKQAAVDKWQSLSRQMKSKSIAGTETGTTNPGQAQPENEKQPQHPQNKMPSAIPAKQGPPVSLKHEPAFKPRNLLTPSAPSMPVPTYENAVARRS